VHGGKIVEKAESRKQKAEREETGNRKQEAGTAPA
jgi:hypothetical protein